MAAKKYRKRTEHEGAFKYDLCCAAFDRIGSAVEQGFNLEAIALLESLLSDRLESRLDWLLKMAGRTPPAGDEFKGIGKILGDLVALEPNARFRDVEERICGWKNRRNDALHSLPKRDGFAEKPWSERLQDLPAVVVLGQQLLVEFDRYDTEDRERNSLARPEPPEDKPYKGSPSTWPGAFGWRERDGMTWRDFLAPKRHPVP